jgi:negative regulator of flagellin synthesis FlgM
VHEDVVMIEQIGKSIQARLEQVRAQAPKPAAVPTAGAAPAEQAQPLANPASALAAEGAPVDSAKVAALRAAIANGSYRIDPDAIAAKMIALDLPGGGA